MSVIGPRALGKIVRVVFWDHARGQDDLVQCEGIGEVARLTPDKVTLRYLSSPVPGNDYVFVVMQEAIEEWNVLTVKK